MLDRSLRPVLLGTWLLRCVEQVEPSVLCHMADFQAFGTEDMLLSADEAELACLAALWRSPQLLNELVQQAEVRCLSERVPLAAGVLCCCWLTSACCCLSSLARHVERRSLTGARCCVSGCVLWRAAQVRPAGSCFGSSGHHRAWLPSCVVIPVGTQPQLYVCFGLPAAAC